MEGSPFFSYNTHPSCLKYECQIFDDAWYWKCEEKNIQKCKDNICVWYTSEFVLFASHYSQWLF